MFIIKTRGCKRCGGDLFLDAEVGELSIGCLQCGARYYFNVAPLKRVNENQLVRRDSMIEHDKADYIHAQISSPNKSLKITKKMIVHGGYNG